MCTLSPSIKPHYARQVVFVPSFQHIVYCLLCDLLVNAMSDRVLYFINARKGQQQLILEKQGLTREGTRR